MSKQLFACLAGIGSILAIARIDPASAEPKSPAGQQALARAEAKLDLYGDRLPQGAISRLGTVRFRLQDSIQQATFTPQGELLVISPRGQFCYYQPGNGKLLRKLETNTKEIRVSAVSQDRKWLAASGFDFHEEQSKYTYFLKVFSTEDGTPRLEFQGDERFGDTLAIAGNGSTVAAMDDNGKLRFWDIEGEIEALAHQADRTWQIRSLELSPDASVVAMGGSSLVALWRWSSGEEPRAVRIAAPRDHRSVVSMAFSPDGSLLAVGADGRGGVMLIDPAQGKIVAELASGATPWGYVRDMAFSSDGKLLATTRDRNQGGGVLLWDVAARRKKAQLETAFDGASQIAFSLDGSQLVGISSWDHTIDTWDTKSGERISSAWPSHDTAPTFIHFLNDNAAIVTAGDDGTVRFWETRSGRMTRMIKPGDEEAARTRWLRGFAVSSDGKRFATSSLDDTVRLFRASDAQQIYRWPGHGDVGGKRAVAFSKDASRAISWGDDLRVYLWDIKTGKAVQEYRLAPSGYSLPENIEPGSDPFGAGSHQLGQSALSPDGSRLILDFGTVHLFDTQTGKELWKFTPEGGHAIDVAISPDNQWLLDSRWSRGVQIKLADGRARFSAAKSHLVTLRRLEDHSIANVIELPEGGAGPVAFSRDSEWFAIAHAADDEVNPVIHVFETATGKELKRITEHVGRLRALAFSSDKSLLAVSCSNGSVVIWDLAIAGTAVEP